jgi:hypothetical protein
LKKGKACNCCSHRERQAIDLGLARGVSVTALARRYAVSTDALYRHRKAHLPAQLRAKLIDLERLRENESQSLLANPVALLVHRKKSCGPRTLARSMPWTRSRRTVPRRWPAAS